MPAAIGRRLVVAGSILFSELVLLLVLRMPEIPGGGSWLQAFRAYFSYDQLSYAAIASTSAAGVTGLPEPFTETGHSYYPSLWYRVLGWLASLTGASVPALWTLAGFAVIAAAVGVIGWIAYRVSGLSWAPALVGPALIVGTLSVLFHDSWFTNLESHAVLWGPYGAYYVLNAEVIGFACVGVALVLVLRATVGPAVRPRARLALLIVTALLLGIVANVQTYTFFVGTGIAFSWLGAYGLVRSRSRLLVGITVALVALTFLAGPTIAARTGALSVYGLFIACTLPGAIWIARRHLKVLALPAVLFVLAALPQALVVASGILAKDPFLTYRQDASALLGVPFSEAVLVSLPIFLVWAFNVAVQGRVLRPSVLAALIGIAFSGMMLTFNGAWGFGQEPYRMWIDSLTVSALLLAPISAWSIARLAQPAARSGLVLVTAGLAVAVLAVSFLDFGAFRVYIKDSGVIRFDTSRAQAIAALTASTDGLISSGPCVDPQELKIISRKPVAFYNLGIAWPENKGQIDAVVDAWRNNTFNADALRAAKVGYLVTDSACGTQWPLDGTMGVIKVGEQPYSDDSASGTITVWRIA